MLRLVLVLPALLAAAPLAAFAQHPGHQKPVAYPQLSISECTKASGCTSSTKPVVIDSNWMWTHKVGTYTNCYTGTEWDPNLCPDGKTCAANCAIEAGPVAEYESTYGVAASGDALTLGFVTKQQYGINVGSRNYLMDDTETYQDVQT